MRKMRNEWIWMGCVRGWKGRASGTAVFFGGNDQLKMNNGIGIYDQSEDATPILAEKRCICYLFFLTYLYLLHFELESQAMVQGTFGVSERPPSTLNFSIFPGFERKSCV